MLNEIERGLAPSSCIPRDAVDSLLDLAQRAFAAGNIELGERLIDLVHESFSRSSADGI